MSLLAAISSSRRRATSVFSPLSLSPSLWLDASDATTLWNATTGGSLVADNGQIARWEDKSGNAKHAIQATSSNRPTRQVAVKNGLDVTRYNYNGFFQIPSITLPTYITAYVVQIAPLYNTSYLKFWFEHGPSIGANEGVFFNGINGSAWAVNRGGVVHAGPSANNADWVGTTWALATFKYDGIGSVYKNKTLVTSASYTGTPRPNTNLTAALNIACRNQNSLQFNGDIGEMLIYPSAHSDTDRALVENYLTNKWFT